MTDSPKRGLFQFHLSTAIVAVLVAGALMVANKSSRTPEVIFDDDEMIEYRGGLGWPIGWQIGRVDNPLIVGRPVDEALAWRLNGKVPKYVDVSEVNMSIDLIVCALIVLTAVLGCEWLIRFRIRRRGGH